MRTQINPRSPVRLARSRRTGGFSLIELLIVVAIILIIAAIAIPDLLHARMAANEATAAENVRTVTTASIVYSTTWNNGFPPSLGALGGPAGSPPTCDFASLVDDILASAPNQKTGYQYTYSGQAGNISNQPANCGAPGFNGYLITAAPISVGVSGTKSYCSDTPGVIHFDLSGSAAASPAACDALPTL